MTPKGKARKSSAKGSPNHKSGGEASVAFFVRAQKKDVSENLCAAVAARPEKATPLKQSGRRGKTTRGLRG